MTPLKVVSELQKGSARVENDRAGRRKSSTQLKDLKHSLVLVSDAPFISTTSQTSGRALFIVVFLYVPAFVGDQNYLSI